MTSPRGHGPRRTKDRRTHSVLTEQMGRECETSPSHPVCCFRSPALVMCDQTNVASRRVTEANGGCPLDATERKYRYRVPAQPAQMASNAS